ncbi:hemerythrin domain-containing protein [Shewanella maritima]|uniref:hemerythrin domain-containing protein n=1 Tax=Shewanella maritima TaxID=2520507 RepID=UPI00373684FA
MSLDTSNLSLTQLIDHIEATHHQYVRKTAPMLLEYISTLVEVHSDEHPELTNLSMWVNALVEDLMPHLMKEEQILFPAIKAMETGNQVNSCFGHIGNPITAMEHEHHHATDILNKLRELTDNYQAPESACKTWKLCYQTLAEFEADLLAHIDIENNQLFTRTLAQA